MTLSEWQILIFSALPVTELRVTIPLAISKGMSAQQAFILAVAGNLIPVVPLLLWLEPLSKWLCRFPFLDFLFQKILLRTRRREQRVRRYGMFGLFLFVAIPFPGTGAWTGAILAWLLGLPVIASAVAISVGVVLAGIIVALASIGVIQLAYVYDFEYLLIVTFIVALFMFWYRKKKKKKP